MPTNLALDDTLINEALRVGGHKTKKAAVTCALREYVQRHNKIRILDFVGRIEYEKNYDYKALRRKRNDEYIH